jgi:class 3 adenylate cyclase/tetratricopeptide (TPR) repeat protein
MDVGEWLRSLGLGQYEVLFRENEIDAEVLPELTDLDLEKFGVPFGHRKRLLKAIASLSGAASAPSPPATTAFDPPTDTAERRQLTVMFCDLVGSTAMSTRLDPEDMRGIIGAYQKCCAAHVTEAGGFVAKYMGDGVLAYFGYPLAHEHDAERAVRAGLAIVEAAPKLETAAGSPLHVRVGIATGIVVVGDLLGSGESQERGVVGDTPNLAARLQSIGAPDSVTIADGTRRLIGDLFEVVDLGPIDLRGLAVPARVFAALRESSQESRFEALHAGALTKLVGREEEIRRLLRRWASAKAGGGQVALISGEAGIGKSRLTAAFLERLAGEPFTRLRFFCSPQHADSALYPFIGQLERAAGLVREDDAKTRLDKLDALLATSDTSGEDAALLADLLSLPNDGRRPARELSPQQWRQKTIEALIAQIEAISRRAPTLLIFEDAHWADPSSLEVVGRLVDKIDAWPVLLFVTCRPEFEPLWTARPHMTTVTINRLAPPEVFALIDRVAENQPLASDMRRDIAERSDGIPLFVEEMTKAVLEAGGESAVAKTHSAVSPALPVPASLHASLMARLDRLGPGKRIAQVGAAIGREFSHALLSDAAGLPEPELASALDRLLQAGLLSRQGVAPHATYLFKHALVQDSAYGTLLREPRRALHARIAEVLESGFPDILESQPELLARHYARADAPAKALPFWIRAGQNAAAKSAVREAVAQFREGLRILSESPEGEERNDRELAIQSGLGPVLVATMGYASTEVLTVYERARELARTRRNAPALTPILQGLFVSYYGRAQYRKCYEVALELAAHVETQPAGDSVGRCLSQRMLSACCCTFGEFDRGVDHAARATAHYDAEKHAPLAWRYVQDIGVSASSYLGIALIHCGRLDQAREIHADALSRAERLNHRETVAYSLAYAGAIPSFFRRDWIALGGFARRMQEVGREHGLPHWVGWGACFEAPAIASAGKPVEAINQAIAGLHELDRLENLAKRTMFLAGLATAQILAERSEAALETIGQALQIGEKYGERWMEAELYRLSGDAHSALGDRAAAENEFRRAVAIAREQGSRIHEVRAATNLAGLWRDQGRLAQAHDLLAPLYGRFTEGFDTRDLKEAKALLKELA